MIRTLFMPSDDSTRLPYFVPANAFAVTELLGASHPHAFRTPGVSWAGKTVFGRP